MYYDDAMHYSKIIVVSSLVDRRPCPLQKAVGGGGGAAEHDRHFPRRQPLDIMQQEGLALIGWQTGQHLSDKAQPFAALENRFRE